MDSSRQSSSQATKSTDPTTITKSGINKTKKSSAYNPGFDQHLTDHSIYATRKSQKPSLEQAKAALLVPRPSLSPSRFSDGAFNSIQEADADAKDEGDIMKHVILPIAGPRDANYPSTSDVVFGNLEPLTDGTIVAPKPDIALGALPEQLHPSIRNELQHHIIPSTATDRLLAPNFFVEAKGPSGSAVVMTRQARYDGAVGARAMHTLQNYGRDEAVYDGNAYTYSSTYYGATGTLQLYAHHTTAPVTKEGRPEYHMTQLKAYALMSDRESFVQGATAYRNLRDLAKQQRDTFIEDANARYHAGIAAAQRAPAAQAEILSEHDSSSDEFVECEDYHTPQNTGRTLHPAEQGSPRMHSQQSTSTDAATEPAASVPTSFTSSLPSGESQRHGTASSKRNRDSESPSSHRLKRHA